MTLLSASLPNRFISISGPDAIKFLQGQASCDLDSLAENRFTFGTLNTPKGRMYSLFKAIKTEDGLLLSINESIVESTLEKLNKYAVFSKCELKEETTYKAYGYTCTLADAYPALLNHLGLEHKAFSIAVQAKHLVYLNISCEHQLGEIWIKDTSQLPSALNEANMISLEHWQALETATGIPEIYSTSQDEFILQYINLHHLDAVSFKKGCYTGQEIIARMKFLGKQKKQAYLLHSQQKNFAQPLAPLFDSEGKKCGTIIRSHFAPETGTYALAILPIEQALSYKTVFLDEALSQALSVSEIDYSEFKK